MSSAVSRSVRLATFNIRHGVGADHRLDLDRVAAAIERTGAEVVCLQEVDRRWGARSGDVDQAGWLAQRLGMDAVYAANVEADPVRPGAPPRQYGMATLTAFPVRDSIRTLLDRPLGGEQRGLLDVRLDLDGTPLRVLNTHLEVGSQVERMAQVATIGVVVRTGPHPLVLLGDLNAEPSSPEVGLLTEALADAWTVAGSGDGFTFDSLSPFARIDYALVSPGIDVSAATVVESDASDHLPVVVDIVVGASGATADRSAD